MRFLGIIVTAAVVVALGGCHSAEPSVRAVQAPAPPRDPLQWTDSLIATMTLEEKVGQLIMVGAYGHYSSADGDRVARLVQLVRDRSVGGVIIWQSDVYEAAILLNYLQSLAQVPLLVGSDMERGPAMRVRRATVCPDAMAIGATRKLSFAYAAGRITAEEARSIGVHQNYAPVADINTNPLNPVINTRSFGDNLSLVREMVSAYVRGTNDGRVLSTAKHFPGHGETGVDSHLALPVLPMSRSRLDSLELAVFRTAVDSGVKSIMVSHLAVPALDASGTPSSVSAAIVGRVLRGEMGFSGLVVTDAMEMRAVTEEFSVAQSVILAVKAGVDMVLMPPDNEVALTALLAAARSGEISEQRLHAAVRNVLEAKRWAGLDSSRFVDIDAIPGRVATNDHRRTAKEIARHAITVLRNDSTLLPLQHLGRKNAVAVIVSDTDDNRTEINRPGPAFPNETVGAYFTSLVQRRNGTVRIMHLTPSCKNVEFESAMAMMKSADVVLLPLYVKVRTSTGRIGIPENMREFVERLQGLQTPLVVVAFGTPYVLEGFPGADALLSAYGDAEVLVEAAVEALFGEIETCGTLPVTISSRYPFGSGLVIPHTALRREDPSLTGVDPMALRSIDDVIITAIRDSAFPGAQLAIARSGVLIASRTYGTTSYDVSAREITPTTLFDLASLTKVVATTASVMKLYDEGRLRLDEPVSTYLPQFAEGKKALMSVRHLLTHRSGFPPFRPFFTFCSDARQALDSVFATPLVAPPGDTTIYSDIGMITMGKVVERIVGTSLAKFVGEELYGPLGMTNTMFMPPLSERWRCAPSEIDTVWRKALVWGAVHDENAALLGGVSGHAGLFSTAEDLARFMQMLLNGGVYGGRRYLRDSTVQEFIGKRAPGWRFLGWDVKAPTGSSAGTLFSPPSFGHTGFTGTSVWVDPERDLVVVLLTNRVHPTRANHKIDAVRPALHDAVVRAIEPDLQAKKENQ